MSNSRPNRVEVILFSLECDDEKRRILYRSLSADEKQRAARYHFDKHRNRFITGRGTIREILAAKSESSPRAIRFDLNSYGKPALRTPGPTKNLQFNASSSDNMGAIAITDGIPLGLDIERLNPAAGRDYDLIVKNAFTRDEFCWYEKQVKPDRMRAFFDLWTCKEAYLKALGIGLSGKLDSFSIDLGGRQPRVSATGLEDGEQSKQSLYRVNPERDFIGCLALAEEPGRIDVSHW